MEAKDSNEIRELVKNHTERFFQDKCMVRRLARLLGKVQMDHKLLCRWFYRTFKRLVSCVMSFWLVGWDLWQS